MNLRLMVNPLPFPQMMNDLSTLKLVLRCRALSDRYARILDVERPHECAQRRGPNEVSDVQRRRGLVGTRGFRGLRRGLYFLCDSIFKFNL